MEIDEITLCYDRLRAVQSDGDGLVDALANFLKERASLEESYSRSLARLAKNSLVVNGAHRDRSALRLLLEAGTLSNRSTAHPPHVSSTTSLSRLQRRQPTRRSSRRSRLCAVTSPTSPSSTRSSRPRSARTCWSR
jgi:hypothetical protein